MENNWYETLRDKYRPEKTRVIFLGESAPDPSGSERRFFYAPELHQHDNFFRGLMLALYGADGETLRGMPKTSWLKLFQDDGYLMLDAVPFPINKLSPAKKRQAISEHVPLVFGEIARLQPSVGVVICSMEVFDILGIHIAQTNLLLHNERIPFPLRPVWPVFTEKVRVALRTAGITLDVIG